MKFIGQHIYDLVSRFRNDVFIENSDLTIYKPINDDPAIINLGSSATERLEIKANYASGTQELNAANFTTYTASTTGNRGRFNFYVDEALIATVWDAGLNLYTNKALQIDGTDIITDSSGTATLSNIDAIDATTITTFNNALNFPVSASAIREGTVELATTAETTTGADTTRAVTPDGLKDGYQGSTNVTTLGTIGTGEWRGTAINATYLNGQSGTNTGDETLASINALDITELGTIDSGEWRATAIASAYIAADAINGDKIANGSVNSEHYVDGSIDTAHIGDAQVTVAKLHGDAVQTAAEIASSFGDNDTSLLTAAAVDDRINTKHTYVYLHTHGRSSTGNANWHFQDASADGEFNWETDGGADAFADTTYTTVDSSTVSLSRAVGVMGMVIPYDCTLVGFKAIGRDLNGDDAFKAGLWSSPAFSAYGGSTSAQTYTLRAVAESSYSGGAGSNFNGICKLDDLGQSYSLSAGQILLPSIAESDADRTYLSMTIVLKVPIIP